MPPLAPRKNNTPSHAHHISSAAPLPLASPNGLPTVSAPRPWAPVTQVHLPLSGPPTAWRSTYRLPPCTSLAKRRSGTPTASGLSTACPPCIRSSFYVQAWRSAAPNS